MNPSQQIRKQAVDAWMNETRGGMQLSSCWIDPLQQLFENLEWSHWDCVCTELSGKERDERSDIWWAIFKACKAIRTQTTGEVTSDVMLAKSVGWAMKPTQVMTYTAVPCRARGPTATTTDGCKRPMACSTTAGSTRAVCV